MTKEQAFKIFGSGMKLAAALKISHQAVYKLPSGEIRDPRGAHVRVVAAELGLIKPIAKCTKEDE